MRFMDALIYVGTAKRLQPYQRADIDSLRRMLDKYGIEKALLGSFAWRAPSVEYGNQLVFETAAQDERLIPCPVVIPNSGLAVGDEEQFVDGLVRDGARCVCFYPESLRTTLDRRIVDALFRALEARRLPMALFEATMLDTASVAEDYPDLPVIVHAPNVRTREFLPSFRDTHNLHITITPGFAPYLGLEVLAEHADTERILFASGYPVSEPGAPIAYLLQSVLPDEDVERIAFRNIERLMAAVVTEEEEPEESWTPEALTNATPEGPSTRVGGVCDRVWRREAYPWDGIIDMHAHYGKWGEFDVWGGDADDLVEEIDRLGIAKIFVAHHSCCSPEVVWGNDEVLKAIERYPDRILGYATCHPVDDRTGIDEVKRCIDAGMRGIKLHTHLDGIRYDDDRYASIWKFADENRIPVLLHTRGALDTYEKIFEQYHEVPILLGHSGCTTPDHYVEFARKYPNIWLELCCSTSHYGLVEHFAREVGAGRMLAGSDAPWMSVQHQFGKVVFADISDDDKKTILVGNPQKILGAASG